jgi:hypothetical protein
MNHPTSGPVTIVHLGTLSRSPLVYERTAPRTVDEVADGETVRQPKTLDSIHLFLSICRIVTKF